MRYWGVAFVFGKKRRRRVIFNVRDCYGICNSLFRLGYENHRDDCVVTVAVVVVVVVVV